MKLNLFFIFNIKEILIIILLIHIEYFTSLLNYLNLIMMTILQRKSFLMYITLYFFKYFSLNIYTIPATLSAFPIRALIEIFKPIR